MERYKNLGGNSNVHSYQIGITEITVRFNGGATYRYTYSSTGSVNVERMKRLAIRGIGLNSLISRTIKKRYASKLI